jgi:excisionase family DNA binding protein
MYTKHVSNSLNIETPELDQAVSNEEVLSAKGAAAFLNLSRFVIYSLSRSGRIPTYRPTGGKIYFLKSELLDWVRSGRRATVRDIQYNATKSITLSIIK